MNRFQWRLNDGRIVTTLPTRDIEPEDPELWLACQHPERPYQPDHTVFHCHPDRARVCGCHVAALAALQARPDAWKQLAIVLEMQEGCAEVRREPEWQSPF